MSIWLLPPSPFLTWFLSCSIAREGRLRAGLGQGECEHEADDMVFRSGWSPLHWWYQANGVRSEAWGRPQAGESQTGRLPNWPTARPAARPASWQGRCVSISMRISMSMSMSMSMSISMSMSGRGGVDEVIARRRRCSAVGGRRGSMRRTWTSGGTAGRPCSAIPYVHVWPARSSSAGAPPPAPLLSTLACGLRKALQAKARWLSRRRFEKHCSACVACRLVRRQRRPT
jgi:hypothetical protein